MEDCSTDERLQQETLCRRQWTDEYVERPETLMRQNIVFSLFRTRQHGSSTGYGVPSILQTHSLAFTGFAFRSASCSRSPQRPTELWTAVHQRTCRHTSPVSLTCHPGGDSDRLLPVNWLSRRSTSPPSENGLFQFPAPTSGTVYHHTLHAHRRLRYFVSVSRHFSSTCHIRTWFSDFPPTSLWTLR